MGKYKNCLKLLVEKENIIEEKQLYCSMAGKGFCPYECTNGDGKCKTPLDIKCVNHVLKK